jgi:hypothetical protein
VTTLQVKKLLFPAREARKQFLADVFLDCINGGDPERFPEDWYSHLIETVGPFADEAEVSEWFRLEEEKWLRLMR